MLKPYKADPSRRQAATPFSFDPTTDAKHVERIIAHRMHQGTIQFLVHYKNTDSAEDTWIDKQHLEDQSDLIQGYSTGLFEEE